MHALDDLRSFGMDRAVRAVRRWLIIIVASALASSLAAFTVSRTLPAEYVASAQLYLAPTINPTVAFQDAILGTNVARSYVQLLTAEVVLRPAMASIDWRDDFKSFKERVRALQVRDTSIITVNFRDFDPDRAASAANAVADSFVRQSQALQSSLRGTTVTQLENQIVAVESDIADLDQQIAALRAQLAQTPKPGQTAEVARAELQTQSVQLDSQRQTKQQTLAQLLQTRDAMRLAALRADSTVSIWQPATPPEEPVSPRVLVNTAVGFLAGALIALLIVLAISYLDDRIVDLDEVPSRLGLTPLGQISLGERPETLAGKLFVRDNPTSPQAEAVRSLRTNIQFASVDARPRTLVITSALPREGKSVVSGNLALAFAQTGLPAVLIDADLRRPAQHRVFGVSASVGLTSLLTEGIKAIGLDRFAVSATLTVIPSGPLPPNPAELSSSARMSHLISELLLLKPDATIIIDTSPVLAAADAVALGTKVDGVLFVVDSARTRTRAVTNALAALRRVHANVLGAVLNKISVGQGAYYYYSDYYGARPPLDRVAAGPTQPKR